MAGANTHHSFGIEIRRAGSMAAERTKRVLMDRQKDRYKEAMKRFKGQTMTRSGVTLLCLLCLLISGCAQVEIIRRPSNDADGLKYAYTARTFFYSNNMEVPSERMLGAVARFCQLPVEGAGNRMNWRGPYGIHGTWMLDFSCPTPAN